MKQFLETVGIDVSKSTLDAHIYAKNIYAQFDNNQKGFLSLLKWFKSNSNVPTLFCFEHTGIYSLPLASFLSKKGVAFAMVPALEIKRSMGIVRGKNDKVDARRIAEYAYLRREKIKTTTLPSEKMQQLKELLSVRERMVKQRSGYKTSVKELKRVFKQSHNPELFKVQEDLINALDKNILVVEDKINSLIKAEDVTHQLYKLVTSVKGIGPVVAANLIVLTNCFTGFENSRQIACYCGVAPFEKQSGTSLKRNSRVSHYADKKMKSLLDRAACSAIQADAELRTYYERRVKEGKSKMSTINIVRNKLLHRVFAVVKRGTPFVEIYRHAA
jgi:transposase